jgi:monoamine oxidase
MAEIVVIGAGISGLTIARALLKKGHSVTVVEAQERIGGRIHSLSNKFSRVVEAGAEFIHGKQPLTFNLLKEAEQKKTLIKGKFYTLSNNELEKGDMLDDHWRKLMSELGKLKHDMTMENFLQQHFNGSEFNDLRERVKQFAEGFDIADVNRVSSLALKEEWSHNDDTHQYRMDDGYGTLIEFLKDKIIAAGGTIILSEPVTEIQWSEGNIKILTTTGKSIPAEKVVITVPLGVLQKKSIRFTPELPYHEQAFESMGFGGVIKFLFEFKEAFWESSKARKLSEFAFVFSDAEVPTWWSQLPDTLPLLTGWLSGPRTFDALHSTESLYQKALVSLQYIFKCNSKEVESNLAHWHIADWVQDPYSFGAYSYPTLKSSVAIKQLSLPVNDTVYFAGEALFEGSAMGTVEAALSSAESVIQTIK